MRTRRLLLSTFLILIVASLALWPAAAQEAPVSDGISLTIYNQGTALVQDRRTFELTGGISTLDFTDVAATIDATSVSFRSLTDPAGTSVLEQNYVFDLVGSARLLERYIDQRIELVTTPDNTTFSGVLLSGRNGEIILQQDDGQIVVISLANARNIRFPALPEGLITRPTLRWLLNVVNPGAQQVQLTYLTGGLNWTADYILLLNEDGGALDLNGWVTLTNTSGASYQDATVKLVAGDVNRMPTDQEFMAFADGIVAAAPAMEEQVAQRDFNEYKLYQVQRPVTVADNETKQVEFVSAPGVPATTFFVYDSSAPFYGYYSPISDPGYGMTGITDVQNWLEFSTGDEAGVGVPLPAGRVRVYQEDIDGAALLIGENSIDHTAKGEPVRLYLGNAFDLVGERIQTNFQMLASNIVEETYEIRLRNRKEDQAVEIRVPERLFRWSNWEIFNETDSFTKVDSANIEFRVTVQPGEERVIRYTVRYTWPN
ncbi:MAG TPA: hypothetical protein PLQ56_14700 [Aggregatilineales bacterium]|nr:hypothetical protein [Aggregatilineales bacterium]